MLWCENDPTERYDVLDNHYFDILLTVLQVMCGGHPYNMYTADEKVITDVDLLTWADDIICTYMYFLKDYAAKDGKIFEEKLFY
jgi:hypothetical protein